MLVPSLAWLATLKASAPSMLLLVLFMPAQVQLTGCDLGCCSLANFQRHCLIYVVAREAFQFNRLASNFATVIPQSIVLVVQSTFCDRS